MFCFEKNNVETRCFDIFQMISLPCFGSSPAFAFDLDLHIVGSPQKGTFFAELNPVHQKAAQLWGQAAVSRNFQKDGLSAWSG